MLGFAITSYPLIFFAQNRVANRKPAVVSQVIDSCERLLRARLSFALSRGTWCIRGCAVRHLAHSKRAMPRWFSKR